MYVLEDLWRGDITPSERGYRKGSKYAELSQQATKAQNLFIDELSQEGRRAYDAFSSKQSELSDISECDTFVRGFRLGARVILDVIGDYASPMCQVNELDTAD